MASSTATRPAHKVGDRVVIKPEDAPRSLRGVVFVVESIGPKNTVARPASGGRGIRYPHDTLMAAPESTTTLSDGTEYASEATTVPILEWYSVGEIVTFRTRPPAGATTETPYVVWKDGGEKVNVSRLGGADGARYFRAPKGTVERRDLAWLAQYLPTS